MHHSDPGNYPKFVVWVEVPIGESTVSEAIYFRPQNQAVTLSEWDLVEVDLVNSKFTNNGVTTDGEKSTGTFAEWLEVIGDYDISEIGIQYNNGNNSYASYIDYIEINGTTFDFEASPPTILEANATNEFLGWTFGATPDVSQAGEAPVTGISDSLGGSASLNFTLSGTMGNKRYVKLRQQDFAAAGLTDITTLSDLTSISWRITTAILWLTPGLP